MEKKVNYIPAVRSRIEKKVGIYCRVSTNEKEQLYSLAAQISALTMSRLKLFEIFSVGSLMVQVYLESLKSCQKQAYRLLPVRNNGISER